MIRRKMMTEYSLLLRIVTPGGDKVLGKFFLGQSRETAYALYKQLHGTEAVEPHHIIFFDFIETKNGLPLDLKLLACDLEQAALNVKIIVKDLFKNSL